MNLKNIFLFSFFDELHNATIKNLNIEMRDEQYFV